MLRTNILSITLLVLLAVGCRAAQCPATNYRGNVYSGKIIVIQLKSSQRSTVDLLPSMMVLILNATITVSHTLLMLSLMWPFQFTVLKLKPRTVCTFSSRRFDLKVFLFFHLLSEHNGHILNGTRSPSCSSLKIEMTLNLVIIK